MLRFTKIIVSISTRITGESGQNIYCSHKEARDIHVIHIIISLSTPCLCVIVLLADSECF